MNEALSPFEQVVADRHAWIRKYKKDSGKKIAGYFCDYVPEEILHAAGMVPVRISGGRGNVVAADRYLQSNVCSFGRRCLDQALEGTFDYLDALVVPHTCDVITKTYDLWAYRMKDPAFVHYLWVPHKVFSPKAMPVMMGEVERLKRSVEQAFGQSISDQALAESVLIYDRGRSLLRQIYRLRQPSPPLISGVQAFTIALSSLLAPRELHIKWMERFLSQQRSGGDPLEARPRVMIAASVLDDIDLIRAVEDSGAWVVADDVCTGSRYFQDLVGQVGDDTLQAIARRYLNKLPCPRSVGSLQRRSEHLLGQARDYAVDGVIFYILRCCDAHMFQYPVLNQRLGDAGYRLLFIQGDQGVGVNETVVNRVKAFTEMLSE